MSKPNPVFTDVAWSDSPKSWFDHSHKWEGTTDFAKLIPIYWDYFRPGDKIKGNLSVFGRSLPLKQPVYGDAYLHVDWFAVPLRLLWSNFTEYITGVKRTGVPVVHEYPSFTVSNRAEMPVTGEEGLQEMPENTYGGYFTHGSLIDYLGGNTFCSIVREVSGTKTYYGFTDSDSLSLATYDAMPMRAYCEIWNEYFRDEQLQDLIEFYDGDGEYPYNYEPQAVKEQYCIQPVCAEKDRFTTARPNPQFGEMATAQSLVTGWSAGSSSSFTGGYKSLQINAFDGGKLADNFSFGSGSININLGTSVANLRAAITLQHLLESRNVGGFRYFEQVLSDFGVQMSDIRAQRPEFLGGDTVPFMINSVTDSVNDPESGSYLGEQAGQGMFSKNTDSIEYEANEDCIVMAVMFVRPRTFYYQNSRKQFTLGIVQATEDVISFADVAYKQTDWMDKFYNPKLQGLGDEVVYQYEVAQGHSDDDRSLNDVFGYASQYSNWKTHPNEVHGEFKGTLKDWLYSRDLVYDTQRTGVSLADAVQMHSSDYRHVYAYNANASGLVPGSSRTDVVMNSSYNDHLLFDLSFNLEVRRSLEFYGTPGVGVV